ncbi:MAG: hypothetical protein ACRDNZ_22780 [Streptosporangiaceae bacterium]
MRLRPDVDVRATIGVAILDRAADDLQELMSRLPQGRACQRVLDINVVNVTQIVSMLEKAYRRADERHVLRFIALAMVRRYAAGPP